MREILAAGGPFRYLEPQDWILRLENEGWTKEASEYREKYIKPPVLY